MKLTVVGGGGFRVPMVYGALLARRDRLPFDDVVLYDVDAARLERIEAVLQGLAAEHGAAVPFTTTTDLDEAIGGADFVFSAIRPGRLEGRVVDESIPLGLGVLGLEFAWARHWLRKLRATANDVVSRVRGRPRDPPPPPTHV